jgi:hypothetical protein
MAALNVAQGIQEMRELFDLPEIKDRIVALQDKAIGFRTDKDPTRFIAGKDGKPGCYPEPYKWDVVRDCCIEATLRGLQLVGNQMNIIASRMYATKEGYEGLIRKLKFVTDFASTLHVPRAAGQGNGVLIECEATWLQHGKPQSIKATIPVKTDNYSTIEQSLGKATRKFLKRCYERMTGNSVSDGDAGEAGDIEVETTPVGPTAPAPDFSGRARKPKASPPPPTANPTPETEPTSQPEVTGAGVSPTESDPTACSELQAQFRDFCADSNVSFDDAVGWLKTTGRFNPGTPPGEWSEIPEKVVEALIPATNDLAKMVKLYGGLK